MYTKTSLTPKQKVFCLEYLKDFNGTQAAIRAGYSKKTACEQAVRLLANVMVQEEIQKCRSKIESKAIMDVQEIQERLTSIARGSAEEEVVLITSETIKKTCKKVGAKEQVKALELLGKANSLFVDKIQNIVPPQIIDDIPNYEDI